MTITIRKAQAEAIGMKALLAFLGDRDAWGYRDSREIYLVGLATRQLGQLEAIISGANKFSGQPVLLKDLAVWRAIRDGNSEDLKPRTLRIFATMLTSVLAKTRRQWVFIQRGQQWLPYWVESVEYHPEQESRDRTPARVDVTLLARELDIEDRRTEVFRVDHIRGTVPQILAERGWRLATEELITSYQADVDRWNELHPQVGRQCLCTGVGLKNVDGNEDDEDDRWHRRSWMWSTTALAMDRDGSPTKVVVDVFHEKAERQNRERGPRLAFWQRELNRDSHPEEDGSPDSDEATDEVPDGEDYVAQVPVHPNLVIFDLRRHIRLRVHCRQLTEYQYDVNIGDRLVLSPDRKALIRLLIEMKAGNFRDIVQGKSGGAVILLAGPPGTGKTLTAEVYAEAEQRALYNVQCSQLGTDPAALEAALLKVFDRAKRWNAVLLLDEADVYVHKRGKDLIQNAIVGVFLRVLEYQDAVLFLTTNRPKDVDDAISSRCIARLGYSLPTDDEQRQVWRVLADTSGLVLDDATISSLVVEHPGLSGRDVKQLLKLAMLISPNITPEAVRFVRQFQPSYTGPVAKRTTWVAARWSGGRTDGLVEWECENCKAITVSEPESKPILCGGCGLVTA